MIKMSRLLMSRRKRIPILFCEQNVKSVNSPSNFCCLSLQHSASSKLQDRYSSEEQKLILQVLNETNTEELKRYAVSKQSAHNLCSFRDKCGSFENLNQVLQVNSFVEHILEQMCDNILVASAAGRGCSVPKSAVGKTRFPIVIPTLDKTRIEMLNAVVGVHFGANAITWANIDKTGHLLEWDIFNLNVHTKKMHASSILEMVLDVRKKIPDSNVYVMEDLSTGSQLTQQQVTSLSFQLYKSQLSAMLLTVLNTTSRSLDNDDVSTNFCLSPLDHRVFYLRSRSPARIFRTLVGSERVSAQAVVQNILSPTGSPVDYTPITIDEDLQRYYSSKINTEREQLCQSLLLTMAFMDLVIFENPRSLKLATKR